MQDWVEKSARERCQSRHEFFHSLLREARSADLSGPVPVSNDIGEQDVALGDRVVPFAFIDLFAGIGGFRIGLEGAGGHCVFSSEWDRWSQKTYRAWFGETPEGDITKIDPQDIPDCDVMAGGFPCQPFSIAGVSKKRSLGKPDGFACERQGNLFFQIAAIAEVKRPPVLFLENVKNLRSHDKGRTWRVIHDTLVDLEYEVFFRVIDAQHWVPQHRERIYIVAFDRRVFGREPPFTFPDPPENLELKLTDILESKPGLKYTLTDHLWRYLQEYAKKHQARGNGFGFGLPTLSGVSRTLSARYFKDGSEILIRQTGGRNPRRLTPLECGRLMGFGDREIVVSDTQAYRQFGNAVVPLVVHAIALRINAVLQWQLKRTSSCVVKSASAAREAASLSTRKSRDGNGTRATGNSRHHSSGQRPPKVHLA